MQSALSVAGAAETPAPDPENGSEAAAEREPGPATDSPAALEPIAAAAPSRTYDALVVGAFTVASAVGAFLLIMIQPMTAKMLLPLLGGSAAVWTTALMFFQIVLLAGYASVHLVQSKTKFGTQVLVFGVLWVAAFLTTPIMVPSWGAKLAASEAGPIAATLAVLLAMAAAPYLVVTMTSPLLQSWFHGASQNDEREGRDPYALYAASNFGSVLAIVSFPTAIETVLTTSMQAAVWRYGFVGYGVLMLVCGWLAWRRGLKTAPKATFRLATAVSSQPAPSLAERGRWIALAAVPSSILASSTSFLTHDVAAVPLLWMLPLAAYLLSFVIVFEDTETRLCRLTRRAAPAIVLAALCMLIARFQISIYWTISAHVAAVFFISLFCHGELARGRPDASRLTTFYLMMALGGALGGVFNAILAPLIFVRPIEYPLTLLAAAALSAPGRKTGERRPFMISKDLLPGVGIAAVAAALVLKFRQYGFDLGGLPDLIGWDALNLARLIAYGLPFVLALAFVRGPLRFAFANLLIVAALWQAQGDEKIVHRERTFFGALKVTSEENGDTRILTSGTTMHGFQRQSEPDKPTSYYHPLGPVGKLFTAAQGAKNFKSIGVIGLGTGTMAAYGTKDTRLTFFEIDPAVVEIATDSSLFTYLEDCRNRLCDYDIVLGDARLKLSESKQHFDLIVVDAFASDAIPIHLITKEAVTLIASRLNSGGIAMFHISNRYLRLEPVLGNIAADLGLEAMSSVEDNNSSGNGDRDLARSTYVAIAVSPYALQELQEDRNWKKTAVSEAVGVWTDDFSNIVSVLH